MWNSLTVLYLALAGVAAALVAGAGAAALRLGWRFPNGAPAGEARDDFDRNHHLFVTLARVGTVAALVAAPLWFAALESLVPAVEGGMCMASVHALGAPISWIASALKALVPALLVYWLVVDRADRSRDDERLLGHKLRVLGVVAVVVVTAFVLDASFFFGLELRPSPCCMALFDGPGIATGAHGVPGWGATVAFGAALGVALVAAGLGRAPRLRALGRALSLAAAPVLVAALVLALHTELGATLRGKSWHCVFCTWQDAPLSFVATLCVSAGAWWLGARAALAGAVRRATGSAPRLRALGPLALVLAGALLLATLALAAGPS